MIVSPEARQTVLDEVVRLFVIKAEEDRKSDDSLVTVHAGRFDEAAAFVATLGASTQIVDHFIHFYLRGVESWVDHQSFSRALRMARTGKASEVGVTKVLQSAIRLCWVDQVLEMAGLLNRKLSKEEFVDLSDAHIKDSSLDEKRGERLRDMARDFLTLDERRDFEERLKQKKAEDDNAISL